MDGIRTSLGWFEFSGQEQVEGIHEVVTRTHASHFLQKPRVDDSILKIFDQCNTRQWNNRERMTNGRMASADFCVFCESFGNKVNERENDGRNDTDVNGVHCDVLFWFVYAIDNING